MANNKQHINASYGHLVSQIFTKDIEDNPFDNDAYDIAQIPTIPGKSKLKNLLI